MLYGRTRFSSLLLSFRESDLEEYGRKEASLSLRDILPLNPKQYDKHRAPKFLGQPTIDRLLPRDGAQPRLHKRGIHGNAIDRKSRDSVVRK